MVMQRFVMRTAPESGIPVMLDGQSGDGTPPGYRRCFAAVMLKRLREDSPRAMLRELAFPCRNEAQLGTMGVLASMAIQGLPKVGVPKDAAARTLDEVRAGIACTAADRGEGHT